MFEKEVITDEIIMTITIAFPKHYYLEHNNIMITDKARLRC